MSVLIGNMVYQLLVIIGSVGKHFPFRVQKIIGAVFGILFCIIAPSRLSIARQNIKLVFPDKNKRERFNILKKSMHHLGLCLWEWMCLPAMTPDDIKKKVRVQNEVLAELISKHGGLILTAHMGNWEYMAAYTAQNVSPISIVYRYFRQQWVEVLWQKVRQKQKVQLISETHGAFKLMRKLGKKHAIGIMCDQHMSPPEGIVVPFFGKPVGMMPGLAVMQMRTHQYVFPVFCNRDWKTGQFIVTVDGKINPEHRRLEEYQQQIHDLSKKYQSYLEKWIKQYPEQWLWVHRRFKHSYDYARHQMKPTEA
jgi:Kdo2-lipid IVA lauroyltransferase/acyltransferase